MMRNRTVRSMLSLLCLLWIVGCGSTSSKNATGGSGEADFTLSASPSTISIAAGSSHTLSISVAATNGFQGTVTVTISGLPSNVTASPATLTLTPGTSQNVTIAASQNASVAKTAITLSGTSGALKHTVTAELDVTAATTPPADFGFSIAPTTLSLTAGASGKAITVNASAQNGFTGAIKVALSGLPAGVTASPSTISLALPGTTQQSVTLTASGSASAGSATVQFTGTSGSLTHNANLALTIAAGTTPPPPTTGSMDVTTYHYDNARDGLNANETILTPANVKSSSFGKLGFYQTDGKVDGQPLYLAGMSIHGTKHNVLYIVTEHDSVYAFDADTGETLWQKSMLQAGETPSDDHGCSQITPEIGITNTPVIDRTLGAIFLVAMSKDTSNKYHQRLHALNLATGEDMQGGPTEITATYPGTGLFSNNGQQVFDPYQYAERVGLLLMNGSIFLGWTSHCDDDPYTGWLMMYDEKTLKQTSVLNLTPNGDPSQPHFQGGEGAIWQAGSGLAGDSDGNVYFLDANGSFDETLDAKGNPAHGDYGNAFMKVSSAGNKLTPADYFVTYNTALQSRSDQDLGSGGTLLLPDMTDANGTTRHLAVGAGKDGNIYIVDRDNMGKYNAGGTDNHNIYQELQGVLSGEFGKPSYFNHTIYYGSVGSTLKAFAIQSARVNGTPSSQTSTQFDYPGTIPVITANGTQDAIVWALERAMGAPAVLHAYDATNLANELYNSNQAASGRDSFGNGNKFVTPIVANGKVFIGTQNGVAVFGLLQ